MSGPPGDRADPDGLTFAQDRLGINVHSNVDSHIDALCHAMWRKTLYNGVSADEVTERGARELSIEVAHDGIAGRGVLLDIPRLRGVPWLEPGDHVTAAELAAAAEEQRVSVGPGDLLFVRTGHRRRRSELGPWDAAKARAGLHPAALEFIAERDVAVLGSDSNSDVAPSLAAGVDLPAHVLAINALGVRGHGVPESPHPPLAEVTVPLATLQGRAERAGDSRLLGPLDPALARHLAAAADAATRSSKAPAGTSPSPSRAGMCGPPRPAAPTPRNPGDTPHNPACWPACVSPIKTSKTRGSAKSRKSSIRPSLIRRT